MPRNRLADLRTALDVLTRDRKSLVECCSRHKMVKGEPVMIPDSLEDDAKEDVAKYDVAIAVVRDVIQSGETAGGRRRAAPKTAPKKRTKPEAERDAA